MAVSGVVVVGQLFSSSSNASLFRLSWLKRNKSCCLNKLSLPPNWFKNYANARSVKRPFLLYPFYLNCKLRRRSEFQLNKRRRNSFRLFVFVFALQKEKETIWRLTFGKLASASRSLALVYIDESDFHKRSTTKSVQTLAKGVDKQKYPLASP